MAEVKVTPGTSGVPEITKPVNNEDVVDVLAQNICEDLLTPHGCLSALKGIATNKAPCLDGFPAEFYLQFWDVLSGDLVSVLNSCFIFSSLALSQRRGIITLLFNFCLG